VTEPVWLQPRLVLALHDMLIAEHGGFSGIRDENLLDSALARPVNLFNYEHSALPALVAGYAAGIVGNHPFIDGNKRTGFAAAATFLDRNGVELTASETQAAQMTIDLATRDIFEEEYAAWLNENIQPL
jgi:death-on-curing protein